MSNVRSRPIAAVVSVTLVLAMILAACSGGTASSPTTPTTPTTPPTQSPRQAVTTPPTQAVTTPPTQAVTTPQQAAERVGQTDQRFLGIPEQTDALIGASAWWISDPIENGGFRITFTSGWGDCPSGCISRHNWLFEVTAAGVVTLVDESGDPLSSGATP